MQKNIDSSEIKKLLEKNSDKSIAQQAEALYDSFQMDKFLFGLSLTKSNDREDRIRRARDINIKDEWGKTVLCGLVYQGNTQLYNMAIQLGADPQIIAKKPNNVNLMYFVSIAPFCNREIIQSLVYDHRLDPNDDGEGIPLFNAISYGCFETFQTLLVVGADPYIVDSNGYTILFHAISWRKTNIIQYIVENYPKLLFEPNEDNELPVDIMGRCCTKTVQKIMTKAYEKEMKKREASFRS